MSLACLERAIKIFIFTRTFNTAQKWFFHLVEKFSFSLSTDLLNTVTTMLDFQNSFQCHVWALLLLHLLSLLCAINLKNDRQASHFCFCLVSGQFHQQALRMKLQSFTKSFTTKENHPATEASHCRKVNFQVSYSDLSWPQPCFAITGTCVLSVDIKYYN